VKRKKKKKMEEGKRREKRREGKEEEGRGEGGEEEEEREEEEEGEKYLATDTRIVKHHAPIFGSTPHPPRTRYEHDTGIILYAVLMAAALIGSSPSPIALVAQGLNAPFGLLAFNTSASPLWSFNPLFADNNTRFHIYRCTAPATCVNPKNIIMLGR